MKKLFFAILVILCAVFNAHAEDDTARHVRVLSSIIGPRNTLHYRNLERAADYIENEFRRYGYEPEEQVYAMEAGFSPERRFKNIIATKEGRSKKDKIIIVCAHYDTHWNSPGADDNASGIAAVLELARRFSVENPEKTVKFIAFTNEELEFVSEDEDTGSYRYAKDARIRGDDIELVICIDMIGYYSDKPGSQERPFPLAPFYPDKGNFIGFGGDLSAYTILRQAVGEFKKATDIPTEYLIIPAPILPGLMTSDNRAFWVFGYQSIWITDTCIYRNPYMHSKNDRAETLDYANMSKVIDGTYNIILTLSK